MRYLMTEEEAAKYVEMIEERYPDHEVECHYGGQPHYFFSLSVE